MLDLSSVDAPKFGFKVSISRADAIALGLQVPEKEGKFILKRELDSMLVIASLQGDPIMSSLFHPVQGDADKQYEEIKKAHKIEYEAYAKLKNKTGVKVPKLTHKPENRIGLDVFLNCLNSAIPMYGGLPSIQQALPRFHIALELPDQFDLQLTLHILMEFSKFCGKRNAAKKALPGWQDFSGPTPV